MIADLADSIRIVLVQPSLDRLRWRTGVQFFDLAVWLIFAAQVLFAVELADLVVTLLTDFRGAYDSLSLLEAAAACVFVLRIIATKNAPQARAFAQAARRDPFLLRDPRYVSEPSRSILAIPAVTATSLGILSVQFAVLRLVVLLHAVMGSKAWWNDLVSFVGMAAVTSACLTWGVALLVGGCQRSQGGVRPRKAKEASPKSSTAPSRA